MNGLFAIYMISIFFAVIGIACMAVKLIVFLAQRGCCTVYGKIRHEIMMRPKFRYYV